MSPSENIVSEVGLNCASFVRSDCCCFSPAWACSTFNLSCNCTNTVYWVASMRGPRSAGEISGSMGNFITLKVISSYGLMPVAFDGVACSTVRTVGKASLHLFWCWAICLAIFSLMVRFARSTIPVLCHTRALRPVRDVKFLLDVQHFAHIFHDLSSKVSPLIWFNLNGCSPKRDDCFAITRATVFAVLLRVGIASTHFENLSIITRQ